MFQSLFENLYNILMRKALVQEDPYKYEQKISELTLPPKGEIPDMGKDEKLSQRLSAFHAQLEFLNSYYQFSVGFIDLRRIRDIIGLVQYIDWANLNQNSPDATTAALAETLGKIRPGSDSVSTGIISTSLAQLKTLCHGVLVQLKDLLGFQRQAYKLLLRRQLLPKAGESLARMYAADPNKAYERLRGVFTAEMKGQHFYKDLALEMLQEEFESARAAELREKALAVLVIPKERMERPRSAPDYKAFLLEAIRLLLPAGGHLQDMLRKISANLELLDTRRQGLGGKLRSWLKKAFQSRVEKAVIQIRYFDSRTSISHTESIELQKFTDGVRRKIALYDSLSQSDSVSFVRLSESTEQQIDGFLKKNIGELQLLYRRTYGLSEYFRQEASAEQRDQLKGIRIELSGLKNSIVRANRRRYEYVSRKEEESRLEQMGVVQSK